MAVITTGNWGLDLKPGIQKVFGMSYKDWPKLYEQIFDVEKVTERYAEDFIGRGLGLMSVKDEASAVTYDTMSQGWIKRYTQVVYATGFTVTREMLEDGHAVKMAREGAAAAKKAGLQTLENLAANVLNRAFNSSYTGGDGKELCATDHPTYAGGTYNNELDVAADFSEASLEQADLDIGDFMDERGLKAYVRGKDLIVPKALKFEAERVLMSVQRPGTADNDVNAVRSMGVIPGKVIVNPYLSDSDAWFIKTDQEKGLRMLIRRELEMTDDNDFDTENAKYKWTMRLDVSWTDPRGIFGSPGA